MFKPKSDPKYVSEQREQPATQLMDQQRLQSKLNLCGHEPRRK